MSDPTMPPEPRPLCDAAGEPLVDPDQLPLEVQERLAWEEELGLLGVVFDWLTQGWWGRLIGEPRPHAARRTLEEMQHGAGREPEGE